MIAYCEHCDGSGLEPCLENLDVKAARWRDYIVCSQCGGSGYPKGSKYAKEIEARPGTDGTDEDGQTSRARTQR